MREQKDIFDRINEALYALLTAECEISQENILYLLKNIRFVHMNCLLGQRCGADCIICDYNYVFDPHVNRKSLIEGNLAEYFILLMKPITCLTGRERCRSADIAKSDLKYRKIFWDRNRFFYLKS